MKIISIVFYQLAEGKKLVRDVLRSRENDLTRSRREVRTLKDRIDHLEEAISGVMSVTTDVGRKISTPARSRLDVLSPGFFATGVESSSDRNEKLTREAIDFLAPVEEKKKHALSIILMELTRLRKVAVEDASRRQYLTEMVSYVPFNFI